MRNEAIKAAPNEAGALTAVQARTLIGKVVSDKMDKTIVVVIERKVPHLKYGKYIRRRTRLFAHDPENQGHVGDKVQICSHRPMSKRKHWALVNILPKNPRADEVGI
jgi:small subunit ribosomal protein S17